MRRDYAITFFAAAAVIVSYLLVLRLVAAHLGTTGFGEYALARRTLSVLSPLALLGVDLAIARFVAYLGGDSSIEARTYPFAGLLVVSVSVAVMSIVLLIFRSFFGILLFGSAGYVSLVEALPLLLTGTAIHAICYAYLRGGLRLLQANLLLVINQAVVPLVAVALAGHAVQSILVVMGLSWTLISLAFLAFTPMSIVNVCGRLTEVMRYGVPRVPADFLQLALFTIPSILVAHVAGISSAGIVALGMAALGMVGSAVSPVNVIMLPVAARLIAQGSVVQLRHQIYAAHRLIVLALIAGTVAIEVLGETIVRLYLGTAFVPGTALLRVIMLGALPWALYVTLKSVIDARHVRAINTLNMLITVATFGMGVIGLRFMWPPLMSIVVAFAFSLYVLGLLTVLEIYRITSNGMDESRPPWASRRHIRNPANPTTLPRHSVKG